MTMGLYLEEFRQSLHHTILNCSPMVILVYPSYNPNSSCAVLCCAVLLLLLVHLPKTICDHRKLYCVYMVVCA